MDKEQVWKNFILGKELSVAGMFIYNGLLSFHQIKYFIYEGEIFEFLYNISVGVERLLKIAIILTEYDTVRNLEKLEEKLHTHNHNKLFSRLQNNNAINFNEAQNDFLILLSDFYKIYRYARLNYNASMTIDDLKEKNEGIEQKELFAFLEKHLNLSFDTTSYNYTQMPGDDSLIKKFVGEIVSKISTDIFGIIRKHTSRLNIYTYEMRYESKAAQVFLDKKCDFEEEDIFRRELLVYFANNCGEGCLAKILKEITPLDFDPAMQPEYVPCFDSYIKASSMKDELESLYEETGMDEEAIKYRKELLLALENIRCDEEYAEE